MTDHPPPLSDEDLSAALDGEAGPDVEARLAADPQAHERAAALAAARDAVATAPEPLGADEVDGLIVIALDPDASTAADAGSAGGSIDDAAVMPLPPRRRGRPPVWLAAAAIAVLLGIGLVLIWSGRSSEPDRRSTAQSGALESRSAGEASSGAKATVLAPTATSSGADDRAKSADAATTGDLGSYPSVAAFRRAFATSFPAHRDESAPTASYSTAQFDRCAEQLQQTLALPAGPTHQGSATIAGKPVLVYEFAGSAATSPATSTSATSTSVTGTSATTVAAVGTVACEPVSIFQR
jgi:hypothetical protein